MALNRKFITAGLATLAVLVGTAAASAAPAIATANVNVRSGPGTGYGVVDTLIRGTPVEVRQCQGSWCFVEKRGPDGWVSSNYLESARPGWNDDNWNGGWNPPPRPRPPVYDPPTRPPYWGNPRPPRPPHWNPPRPQPWPSYPSNPGGSVCFNGPNGYFCVGN